MEYLYLYLLQVADKLEVLLTFATLGLIVSTIVAICCWDNYTVNSYLPDDELAEIKRSFKISRNISIILLVLIIFLNILPTKQTLINMGGLYISKKIITNKRVKDLNTIIDLQLDNHLKQLQKHLTR